MNKSILIIEDDEEIRSTIKGILENEGYTIFIASNGEDALKKLKVEKIRPNLILLDLIMPKMNGWNFLEVQHEDVELVHIPVVVLSGAKDKIKSLSMGYVQKPIDINSLLETVDKYCGKPIKT